MARLWLFASLLLSLLATGCGGSSSETPYPLEPVPHASKHGSDEQADELLTEDADSQDVDDAQ